MTEEHITQEAYVELERERDRYKRERDNLDERLDMIINTGCEDGYTIAEKAIMATIMDSSKEYGPVYVRIGQHSKDGKAEKGIAIHDAPDGVLRALMDCMFVAALDMRYGRMIVEPVEITVEDMG